jgi:hypothetical protein
VADGDYPEWIAEPKLPDGALDEFQWVEGELEAGNLVARIRCSGCCRQIWFSYGSRYGELETRLIVEHGVPASPIRTVGAELMGEQMRKARSPDCADDG